MLQGLTKMEYESAHKQILALRESLLRDAELETQSSIASAKVEIATLKTRNDQILENERKRLYEEVNTHLLTIASDINQKVLSDYTFSEDEMLSALKKELVNNDYQH